MAHMRILFLLLLGFTGLVSCKKEGTEDIIDLGYDFFPNKLGTYITYSVDSISYGLVPDTASFELMEVLAEDFVDGTNQSAMTIERYKRYNPLQDWVLTDVWTQKRTSSVALRTEENVTFVRLVFPIEDGKTWNGNAYNTNEEWNYEIENLDAPAVYGDFPFSKTLKVNQRNYVNLVDQEIAYEIYARGVGLIYKKLIDLNYQDGMITGVDLEMTVVDYGEIE